jgi:hypothetical protein
MKTIITIMAILFLFACTPTYKAKHGKYLINSKGDTCLPCKHNYIYKNDTCYFNIRPSRTFK